MVGKGRGGTPHCRQAEADKKVIHVWLTELRRYHNLLLVWLQMLLRIQVKVPSPHPTCRISSLPCPWALGPGQAPSQVLLSVPSAGTGWVWGKCFILNTPASKFQLMLTSRIATLAWSGPTFPRLWTHSRAECTKR